MAQFTLFDIVRALVFAGRWTLVLSAIAFAGGAVVGLAVLVCRLARRRVLRLAAGLYIEFFQGTPLLMQMFLAFFGLPLMGVDVSPLLAASLSLILFSSAYLAEIWRGAIGAIPPGQWEAARSLGLGPVLQWRLVILPQALKIAIPPTVGFSAQIIKDTALASIIGFVEVTRAGAIITNVTFRPFTVYALVALLYFLVCFPVSQASGWLERRLKRGGSRDAAPAAGATALPPAAVAASLPE